MSRKPLWVADQDGIGHARALSRSTRALCGIRAIDERYGWPARVRCPVCASIADATPAEAKR